MNRQLENSLLIQINTIENTKKIVEKLEQFKPEIDARQGRYTINAKSIMGLFSLDITKPIWIEMKSRDRDELVKFYHEMEEFEVEGSEPERRNSTISEWFRDLKTY